MTISETEFSISDKAFTEGTVTDNLRRVRDAGFDFPHFSHRWTYPEPLSVDAVDEWKAALEETGVRVLDVHGCHPKDTNLWSEDDENRTRALEFFRRRLQVTHELGGDAMVYHVPCHVDPVPAVIDRFLDGLARMEDTARRLGIVVALENHYLPENDRRAFTAAFEKFDSDYIGFTFDPGHALISGTTDWLLENCMERLRILHLNDNDSESDHHWNPFQPEGNADWDRIADAIARSPYRKPLQLEVCWRQDKHGSHEDFLYAARAAAGKLAEQTRSVIARA